MNKFASLCNKMFLQFFNSFSFSHEFKSQPTSCWGCEHLAKNFYYH
ncbi:hypothetical protein pb186bvf_015713 [Paramecium bursaria]